MIRPLRLAAALFAVLFAVVLAAPAEARAGFGNRPVATGQGRDLDARSDARPAPDRADARPGMRRDRSERRDR